MLSKVGTLSPADKPAPENPTIKNPRVNDDGFPEKNTSALALETNLRIFCLS